MIDIGVNLANRAFDRDRDDVLRRAAAAGVQALIVTGTSVAASHQALTLAQHHAKADVRGAVGDPAQRPAAPQDHTPTLYATAGVHPHDAGAVASGWLAALDALAAHPLVVAIGETGLDYNRNYSSRADQRRVFRAQVELAARLGKPLFVHDRDSAGETRSMLAEFRGAVSCLIHCFTGRAADLDGYLEDGHSIGVTGWICDERRGQDLARLVERIPADRLMIETDAPFLLPRSMTPKPRSRRNEPAFLPWVARRVAECRGEDAREVAERTRRNAVRFFQLASKELDTPATPLDDPACNACHKAPADQSRPEPSGQP